MLSASTVVEIGPSLCDHRYAEVNKRLYLLANLCTGLAW